MLYLVHGIRFDMESHITVRDVLLPEFVGASESDTVPASARLLLEEQSNHLVVLRGSDPVGLVSIRGLLQQYVDGDAADTTLGDVMTDEYETISPDVSVSAAADRFVGASRPLLVVDDGELIGLLTERDLLTAPHSEPSDDTVLVNEESNRTGEKMNTTNIDDATADQGICEACGAFTRTLTVNDGRTLCSDCQDV